MSLVSSSSNHLLRLQLPSHRQLRGQLSRRRSHHPQQVPFRCAATDSPALRAVAVNTIGAISAAFRALTSAMGGSPAPAYSPDQKWWTPDTVAVVTGSNKGIGFAIVRGLSKAGLQTVLTSRDPKLGEEAVEKLRGEGLGNIVYRQLDITDKASVKEFAKWLEATFGGVDILVNNAGFAYKGNTFGADEAQTTIGVNYQGTRAVSEALLPLLRNSPHGARIVNVSSRAGLLKIVSPDLQRRLTDPDLTLDKLDELASEFVAGIKKGNYKEQGWPQSMYGISKVLESAYTRVLARELKDRPEGQKVFVNACCPGYVATDMSSHMGYLTPDQGADTPILLSLRPAAGATSGTMYAERKEISF